MKYILKQSTIPFLYLIFSAMLGLAIMVLGEKYLVIEVILNVFNLAFYTLIICSTAYKDGGKALDVRNKNDRGREIIARTGENITLQVGDEYHAWKGFAYGAVACIPLVVLLIIHTVSFTGGGLNTFGMIAGILYMPTYSFFLMFGKATSYTYFYALIALPYISGFTGVFYCLGAKKSMRKYEEIKRVQKMLHGE